MAASNYAKPVRQLADLKSIPAPTGGLNARDGLMGMQPDQAITLTNFFPTRRGAQLRLGWGKHSTVPAISPPTPAVRPPVESLMNYAGTNGAERLFAAAGGKVYDVTARNTAPVEQLTGLGNARWQYTMMTNAFNNFLVMVNGVNVPQKFNGSVWSDCVLTSLDVSFDPRKLIHVHLVHRRLWFTEVNSTKAWYLPVDEVQGSCKLFSTGELFPRGGFLQCIKSWTVDSAIGSDDRTVFISSEGDVAIYSGFDPEDADLFSLDGIYRVGATLGRRCAEKYGSDLLILCEDGAMPLTQILSQSRLLEPVPLTDMIQLKFSDDVALYSNNFGWAISVCYRTNQLYLNVPAAQEYRQYVMNTVTGAWCEFTGYNGICWSLLNSEIYFGRPDGIIGNGWYGVLDAYDYTDQRGGSINGTALGAFTYMGKGAYQKHITMARANMQAPTEPQMRLSVAVDFETEDVSPPIPPASIAYLPALWDQALWDQAKWGASVRVFKRWFGVGRMGFCAAPFLKLSTGFGMLWIGTDFQVLEGQGML